MQGVESRDWYYNELRHIGWDYDSAEEVRLYDEDFGSDTDRSDEIEELIQALALTSTSTVLDIGAATGTLAIGLAKLCRQVYAIDISEPMLESARDKVKRLGLDNIEFVRAGFLTYQHADNDLDAVYSKYAFHHLPEHWKFVALKRIFAMLKPKGRFFLKDAILSIDIHGFYDFADEWIQKMGESFGDRGTESAVLYIRDEYPTYTWIVEEMLKRVGFVIDSVDSQLGLHTTFVCSKPE